MLMAQKNTASNGASAGYVSTNTIDTVQIWTTLDSLVVALSLLRATSGSNQLGLVAKSVKENVWLCCYLSQRSGPDTKPRRGTRRVRGFQQRSESVSLTQNLTSFKQSPRAHAEMTTFTKLVFFRKHSINNDRVVD
jgi:hypothetical protein